MKVSKDVRRLRKKIRQIEHLEGARRTLTQEEKQKVVQKDEILAKLRALAGDIPVQTVFPTNDKNVDKISVILGQATVTEMNTSEATTTQVSKKKEDQKPTKKKVKKPNLPLLKLTPKQIDGNHHQLRMVRLVDNFLVTGNEGAAIQVFDSEHKLAHTVPGHRGKISGLEVVERQEAKTQFGVNGPVLISACSDGYLRATVLGEDKLIAKHYFYSDIISCQLKHCKETDHLLVLVLTKDQQLTVLKLEDDEFVSESEFSLSASGDFRLTNNGITVLDDEIIRIPIENLEKRSSEWVLGEPIEHETDRLVTSFDTANGDIVCGTNGNNIRVMKRFRKIRNHGTGCFGVSYCVQATENYIVSSSFDLLKNSAQVHIRDKKAYDYLGSLVEEPDFGSIRCIYATEKKGAFQVVTASDDCVTLWTEESDAFPVKYSEEMNETAEDTDSESDSESEVEDETKETLYKSLFERLLSSCNIL